MAKFHAMKTWALDGRKWSISCPNHFSTRKEVLSKYSHKLILILKIFAYLLLLYLKWRRWTASATHDPVHTARKCYNNRLPKNSMTIIKNFQVAGIINIIFIYWEHHYHHDLQYCCSSKQRNQICRQYCVQTPPPTSKQPTERKEMRLVNNTGIWGKRVRGWEADNWFWIRITF